MLSPDVYQPRHGFINGTVVNDGFFPDIDLLLLQKQQQLDPNLTPERLHSAVEAAVLVINADLYPWVCTKMGAGYLTLDSVPDLEFNGRSRLVGLYLQAVALRVKGDIARDKANVGMTQEALSRQTDYHDKTNDYYRQSVWACRLIKGKRMTKASFI